MISKKVVDCAQGHVVSICKCALPGWYEFTRVEKPLVKVPQVREELAGDHVELLCERAAEVSNILMYGPFVAVLR